MNRLPFIYGELRDRLRLSYTESLGTIAFNRPLVRFHTAKAAILAGAILAEKTVDFWCEFVPFQLGCPNLLGP